MRPPRCSAGGEPARKTEIARQSRDCSGATRLIECQGATTDEYLTQVKYEDALPRCTTCGCEGHTLTDMNIRNASLIAGGENAPVLVAALRNPALYPHPVQRVGLIETHISWVLLTGAYAYKIKKPVNLGFLDFTTLAARRHYCAEELRLNRRLAPDLYLDIVPITGTTCSPAIGGNGPALDYAVKMREFPQSALLDAALARNAVDSATIVSLARMLADFHAQLAPQEAAPDDAAEVTTLGPARDNFMQMLPLLDAPADIAVLAGIQDWTLREYAARAEQFTHRCTGGYVRECHGDLHLGNIALIDGAATPFDCVEFSPALRLTDVMSEVAFLMMDLEAHARPDLAYTFLNTYLETSGDYDGVALLPFFVVYRAVVRAKINLIRATQPGATAVQCGNARAAYHRYAGLAAARTTARRGAVIITHGLSGSGKTTLTQPLPGALGAVRIRSDVERKRLHGLPALARTGAATGGGIYTGDATARTYKRLLRHARTIAGAGLPVIIDAAFLMRAQRAAFQALARELGVPFAIVNVIAAHATLRARVAARDARGNDASEATIKVLDAQSENCETLAVDEMRHTITAAGDAAAERNLCDQLARKIRCPPPT